MRDLDADYITNKHKPLSLSVWTTAVQGSDFPKDWKITSITHMKYLLSKAHHEYLVVYLEKGSSGTPHAVRVERNGNGDHITTKWKTVNFLWPNKCLRSVDCSSQIPLCDLAEWLDGCMKEAPHYDLKYRNCYWLAASVWDHFTVTPLPNSGPIEGRTTKITRWGKAFKGRIMAVDAELLAKIGDLVMKVKEEKEMKAKAAAAAAAVVAAAQAAADAAVALAKAAKEAAEAMAESAGEAVETAKAVMAGAGTQAAEAMAEAKAKAATEAAATAKSAAAAAEVAAEAARARAEAAKAAVASKVGAAAKAAPLAAVMAATAPARLSEARKSFCKCLPACLLYPIVADDLTTSVQIARKK